MYLEGVIEELRDKLELRRYKKGDVLWFKGDLNYDGIFFLRKGKLKAIYYSPSGKAFTVNLISPPSILGEISAILGYPHSLTVEAVEDSELLLVPFGLLREVLKSRPEIWEDIATTALKRLWRLTENYLTVVSMDAKARVLNIIRELAGEEGIVELTHEEIASLCALTRETVSRVLKQLEREGIISLSRGKVILRV